MAAIYQ